MRTEPLTDARIRKIPPAAQEQNVRDSKCLFLRVPAGNPSSRLRSAAWIVRATHDGRTTKSVVGHWPGMNPDTARKERDRILGIGLGLTTTVTEATQNYRHLVLDHQRSGWQLEPYLKDLEKHVGHRKLATVKKAEYVTLVQRYGKERGVRTSARYLGAVRGMLNLAVESGQLETSPLAGVTSRITGYKPQARERVLDNDEIRQLWSWTHPNAALLRFLLLTGLRIAEAQKCQLDRDRWIVPAEMSKNGVEHWVFVTDLAKEQLQTPFDRSATAVQAWVKRKLEKLQVDPRWTPHDLRRTAVTRMNDVGVDPFVAERAVGHTLPTKMMTVYNRAVFEAERVDAIKRLTAHIKEVTNGKQ
ncbi:tyrosine-type recombinase/integrase [Pseudomonadota bacterium]